MQTLAYVYLYIVCLRNTIMDASELDPCDEKGIQNIEDANGQLELKTLRGVDYVC